jgi:predicted dehydrogenase
MARIGIIGRGWGARVQEPAFAEAGLEVVAVVGRDGWRELIARDDVDLVSVVMPPSMHLEIATAALRAGKHVLCEKPTALNAGEAEQLLAAANEHADRIALIDHELRFLPSFRAARERIAEIGAVRYADVRYASPSRGDRSRAWNWWSDAAQGGGIWGAVGSHFVDTLRYLGLQIEAAQATMMTLIDERPFEGGTRRVTSDDYAAVNLRLSGPRSSRPLDPPRPAAPGRRSTSGRDVRAPLATMTLSAVASGPDEPTTITIHGEEGAMRLVGEELLIAQRGEPFTRAAGGAMDGRRGNSAGGAFGSGTLHLGRALRAALDDGDRQALAPAATFEDGLAQQRVLDAARASHERGGAWVKV